jgi:hypothetical protein
LNIIKRDKTKTGCKYMDWIILVRETYDTGLEYNCVRYGKSLETLNNLLSLPLPLHTFI